MEWALAYALAKKNGLGGRERTIHWEEMPELEGAVVRVWSVRSAYTGTYFPPSGGGYDSWTGEWDYEPGGLSDMKCHRIAKASLHHAPLVRPAKLKGLDLEIPVYHLEKLER